MVATTPSVKKETGVTRLLMCAAIALSFMAGPAVAVTDLEKKDPAKEIVYRTNLGRAADVKLLIKRGISPNQTDDKGAPLVALAAMRKDNEGANVLKALLDAGADVNARDAEGQNALFYAIREDNKVAIQTLLDRGISYYATDNNGNIARTLAFQQGKQDIVDMLDQFVIAQTAKVNEQYKEYNRQVEERNKQIVEQARAATEEAERAAKEHAEKLQAQYEEYSRQIEEQQKAATDEAAAAAKAKEENDEYVETLEAKKVREAVEKRSTPQFETDMRAFAFQNCAFQYWSFCREVKQRSDLSQEEMRIATDTHREQVTALFKSVMSEYMLEKAAVEKISKNVMQRVNDSLVGTQSNTYRFEHGVCQMPDLQTRCTEISDTWNTLPAEKPKAGKKSSSQPPVKTGIGGVGNTSNY